MKIHTYFAPCNGMDPREQSRLLDIWRRAWKQAGWEPVILTPRDARVHPEFAALSEKFRAFPTKNGRDYEMACFHRWLAMAVTGGTMVDYDVLPFGFTPDMIPENNGPLVSILADNNPCPCAVSGTAAQYDTTIHLMANLQPGDNPREPNKDHFSDQSAVQALTERLRPHIHDMCPEYRSRHWHSAPMVHYAHGATSGFDRAELMRKGAQGIRE